MLESQRKGFFCTEFRRLKFGHLTCHKNFVKNQPYAKNMLGKIFSNQAKNDFDPFVMLQMFQITHMHTNLLFNSNSNTEKSTKIYVMKAPKVFIHLCSLLVASSNLKKGLSVRQSDHMSVQNAFFKTNARRII